ncbi:nacht and wd [Fusarium albosuccineum]|uniref:Nacht and wd n=1 Tax=Fusarium albosuccineum TaxID=1237068 RepID=A0A8H4KZ67_9HYPO|nr:nacht and wd [Fusarium albosuccineum]
MFSRKQRRATADLPPDSASSTRDSIKGARNLFSLSKTLTWASRSRTSGDQAESVKGPLGLSLVYSPLAPKVDFIFVHGLGGNSRKTWGKASQFWPEEWLPKDDAFENVRIHTYGYDAYYLKGQEDCLNIHHIGKSLLGAISTSPYIADSGTYIVVIGHSMGGLVLKKAYILAKQDEVHTTLAERFAAFYFLATPHRGADSARLLKNLLKIAYDRAYVGDLQPNSGAIQVINDEFRHFSAGLELWSFYETQIMKRFSSLIVHPESAVLGYREEKQVPMTADHRTICKFDSPEDSNYSLLRNALASTVKRIVDKIPETERKQRRDRAKSLKKYLRVSGVLDDDFANVREARVHGSCEWISTKTSYVKWKDGESSNDRTLWIKGKPAAGKSVLAGYVIDQLKESGQAVSYFFFKHGDESKSSLGSCLRSLAFQMAISNVEAGDAVLGIQEDGVSLDRADERTLWRILFSSGIFRTSITRHYLVIDALDECSSPSVFLRAIYNMDESIPLRILVTGRDTVDLEQGFSAIPSNLMQSLPVLTSDTESDLRLLIEKRTRDLGVVGAEDRDPLAEKILDKSKGSFLWTILAVEELVHCHSRKEIFQVLEDVPRGMESLYKRTLDIMSEATRGKELAKTILMWAACSVRPLRISELDGALTQDTQDSFLNLEKSIATLCGQLVTVDTHGRVDMVHETAREFLIAGGLESEFSINKTRAHTEMARVCLKYLSGEEMKPPRNTRHRSSAISSATRLDFATYAYTACSFHLSKADPSAADTFQLVVQFLKSNVFTWMETIADSQNLNYLIQASEHLNTYVNACAVDRSPQDPQMQAMRQWAIDLARIPAVFGNALTASPSAIHSSIPPFCPTESMVHNTWRLGQKLEVLGAPNKQWDDRLLSINFHLGRPRVLRYGDEFLAVGLSSGTVILYYTTSHQECKALEHGESVSLIAFGSNSELVATCGRKMVKVWDIRSGQVMHNLASPPQPMEMEFNAESLLIASRNNYIITWDLGYDKQPEPIRRLWSDTDAPEMERKPPPRAPCALTISTSHSMLAIAYSRQPIILWDMKEDAYAGSCGKKQSNGETYMDAVVVALAFNPNPDTVLLAVAYLDGDLVLLDPFADRQLQCLRANCQSLTPSPNGHLLATNGADGIVNVYEFESFKLLYRVKSSNSYIKQLAFSRDSMHLADIRGTQCNVWEPKALLGGPMSDGDSGSAPTTIVETVSTEAKAKITVMAVHHMSEVIFCGKDDGSVVLYERKTATSLGVLYSHKVPIRILAWIERRDALLSIDAASGILLYKIQKSECNGWLVNPTVLFESHLDSYKAIIGVIVEELATKFLVSTRESDHMFNLDTGKCELQRACPHMPGIRKWIPHPKSSLHLIHVDNIEISVCRWSDWSKVSSTALSSDNRTAELKNVMLYSLDQGQRIVLDFLHPGRFVDTSRITVIDAECLAVGKEDAEISPGTQVNAEGLLNKLATHQVWQNPEATPSVAAPLGSQITTLELSSSQVIGVEESGKLVFLDRSFWVCTVDFCKRGLRGIQDNDLTTPEVLRHFFVPSPERRPSVPILCFGIRLMV